MTEVEKLRALLAEARSLLDRNRIAISEYDVKDLASVRVRIDAALAELVGPVHPSSLTDVVTLLEQERDEHKAKREEYASEARSLRARLADECQNYADAIAERNKAEARDEAARALLSALCAEFECAVAHADWRAAGSLGMSVPFTGDFASATQLPSVVGRMRWWAREMRKVIGGTP